MWIDEVRTKVGTICRLRGASLRVTLPNSGISRGVEVIHNFLALLGLLLFFCFPALRPRHFDSEHVIPLG